MHICPTLKKLDTRRIRQRQLKKLWKRLHELKQMDLRRDQLLLKLGAARQQSSSAWRFVDIVVPEKHNELFHISLNKDKLRKARRREGRYLLRTNLIGCNPAEMWQFYIQLTYVEEAFKNLKGDLAIRPVHHQKQGRIESHILIAFMAYALHVTLRQRLYRLAQGLTPRSVIEKLSTVQMLDIHLPTTDGHRVIMSRYTQPEPDVQILLKQLQLNFPSQPSPRMALKDGVTEQNVVKTF